MKVNAFCSVEGGLGWGEEMWQSTNLGLHRISGLFCHRETRGFKEQYQLRAPTELLPN